MRNTSSSLMDYINGFFSDKVPVNNNTNSSNDNSDNMKEKELKKYIKEDDIKGNNENTIKQPEKSKNNKMIDEIKSNLQENKILEDYWMIKSDSYSDSGRFPMIKSNGISQPIALDADQWRLNKNSNIKLIQFDPKIQHLSNKLFYFYLTKDNIYYTSTKEDKNILDAFNLNIADNIRLDNKQFLEDVYIQCIILEGKDGVQWKMCHHDEDIVKKWYCSMKMSLNIEDRLCRYDNKNSMVTEVRTQPIIVIPTKPKMCNENWDYDNGGDDWECLCREGLQQSPIDIPYFNDVISTPVRPMFDFYEVKAKLEDNLLQQEQDLIKGNNQEQLSLELGAPMHIQLMDNSLKIFHKNIGKAVTVDGAVYHAEEITFHTPGEHKIAGRSFDMEMQITFFGQSKGDIGKQLLLCFPIIKKPGEYNRFFEDLDLFNLPNYAQPRKALKNSLYIPRIFYSTKDYEEPEMKPFSFYTYQGSLTAPPCSEDTIVYVASEPIPLGTTAIGLFAEAIRKPINKVGACSETQSMTETSFRERSVAVNNNRNVQPLNGRNVFFYDHEKRCGFEKKRKFREKESGHYEKMLKTEQHYFYVDSSKPSGLPGSTVITKKEAMGYKDKNDSIEDSDFTKNEEQ